MKNVIVTGAYGTIGKEIAKGLLDKDVKVFLVGRNQDKLKQLEKGLNSKNHSRAVETCCVDLACKEDIARFAQSIHENIDVLINNAAIAPVNRLETKNGIEMQWATNVLGYYWMIKAFESHLLQANYPRVVNVASYWAGGLDLDDPEFKIRKYNNDTAYRQSKQADRMLSYGLAELYKGKISINACHPGDANSKLSNDLGFGGSESAKQAAVTPILLATEQMGIDHSGEYFEHGSLSNCYFKNDKSMIKRLLEICRDY
jgi:NAD(P)-dependent dehydrogenase (short-subunit alcohol dehydrogenase family)